MSDKNVSERRASGRRVRERNIEREGKVVRCSRHLGEISVNCVDIWPRSKLGEMCTAVGRGQHN